jgi:predicted Rossmann fold flavoprotein
MPVQHHHTDIAIIGAGAAGMMAAAVAGQRGRRVWLADHRSNPGEKIRISGGGRCNFTNIHTSPEHFLSSNTHFCKSALAQYTPADFIALVERHGIAYHEKKLGQLFCDHSAKDIIAMLVTECQKGGVEMALETAVHQVEKNGDGFRLKTSSGLIDADSLIIATGGLSIPKIGATGFGYDIARQFGHDIIATRAGLVPLTFDDAMLHQARDLAGVSVDASVSAGSATFQEGLLFTHRGLSGPSVLQASSYWHDGDAINVNLTPDADLAAALIIAKKEHPKQDSATALAHFLPKRLAQQILDDHPIKTPLGETPDKALFALCQRVQDWQIFPNGTEGYRTAEVTLGGVDPSGLNSKTMESKNQKGLYFIGEVVDVTGHLGGFNFQWAWSSAYVAGQSA